MRIVNNRIAFFLAMDFGQFKDWPFFHRIAQKQILPMTGGNWFISPTRIILDVECELRQINSLKSGIGIIEASSRIKS